MEYSNSKELIYQTEILSDDDMAFIDAHIDSIQNNWEKNQRYRTETEMRISVLNDVKFPTPAAKYWQCVREQSVFYEQLVYAAFQYRTLKIDQEQLARDIERLQGSDERDADLELRRKQIELEQLQFAQLNAELDALDRVREIRLWAQIMGECATADPDFDTENPSTHQAVSYVERWRRQAEELGDNASPSERWNLLGQLQSGERYLKEQGLKLKADAPQFRIRFEDLEKGTNVTAVRRKR